MKLNRVARRKQISKIANAVIKNRAVNREKALSKRPIGVGLIVTTHMIAVIFWRWTWTIMDRRLA